MNFIIDNLEIIVGLVGGISIGTIMIASKERLKDNDLTDLYIKYKKHSNNINKSSKSIF